MVDAATRESDNGCLHCGILKCIATLLKYVYVYVWLYVYANVWLYVYAYVWLYVYVLYGYM